MNSGLFLIPNFYGHQYKFYNTRQRQFFEIGQLDGFAILVNIEF